MDAAIEAAAREALRERVADRSRFATLWTAVCGTVAAGSLALVFLVEDESDIVLVPFLVSGVPLMLLATTTWRFVAAGRRHLDAEGVPGTVRAYAGHRHTRATVRPERGAAYFGVATGRVPKAVWEVDTPATLFGDLRRRGSCVAVAFLSGEEPAVVAVHALRTR